jgi:hypothetical protein
VQALETCLIEVGKDLPTFCKQPAGPTAPAPPGTILVVPADGAETLPQHLVAHFPGSILILGITHPVESQPGLAATFTAQLEAAPALIYEKGASACIVVNFALRPGSPLSAMCELSQQP